jgi:Zn-dependent protease with chaperone function
MTRGAPIVLLVALLSASTACAGPMTSGPPPTSADTGRAAPTTTTRVDPAQAVMQVSGPDSGGFFATHPRTADRIAAVQKMP